MKANLIFWKWGSCVGRYALWRLRRWNHATYCSSTRRWSFGSQLGSTRSTKTSHPPHILFLSRKHTQDLSLVVFFASAFRIVWCPNAEDLCCVNSAACFTVTVQISDFKNMAYWRFSILKVCSACWQSILCNMLFHFITLICLTNLTFSFISFLLSHVQSK